MRKKPVHPREKHWFRKGQEAAMDKRRKLHSSLDKALPIPRNGGTYIHRYRDMFELGFHQQRLEQGLNDG